MRSHCLVFSFFFVAMEGYEAYDVVEDIGIDLNEVIEGDILDDEDMTYMKM